MEKPGSNNNNFSKKPKFTSSPYKIKNYTCRFCGRSFFNPQALGGHQNAHRRERDEVKDHTEEMRKMMMACIGMPYMPLAYIESHGHPTQQIIVGQPMFSWTSPLSSSVEWPGIYRVHDGAPIEPVPEPSITNNDVIDAQSQDDVHQRLQLDRFELPDLNLDPSTTL